jgi:hypothetical protein
MELYEALSDSIRISLARKTYPAGKAPRCKEEFPVERFAEVFDRDFVVKRYVIADRDRTGLDPSGLESVAPRDEPCPVSRVAVYQENATNGHRGVGQRWERGVSRIPVVGVDEVFEELLDVHGWLRFRGIQRIKGRTKCSGFGLGVQRCTCS